MKYAPITSEDVESSFSTYKNILSDNGVNFTTENIGKYMVVNSFLNLN
ncbi:Dimer Tnp hAT domain-containing protein [Aphis craccivora]|uniref:Dimer Tnp hAT domain-containing protein n=1 Tax=Aphis craccivora TaxID=307492 RepID=A0A6G0Z398_APHCR|nr:Dimer Tnp hAT domain-containing protein [Aphis craccivora]